MARGMQDWASAHGTNFRELPRLGAGVWGGRRGIKVRWSLEQGGGLEQTDSSALGIPGV